MRTEAMGQDTVRRHLRVGRTAPASRACGGPAESKNKRPGRASPAPRAWPTCCRRAPPGRGGSPVQKAGAAGSNITSLPHRCICIRRHCDGRSTPPGRRRSTPLVRFGRRRRRRRTVVVHIRAVDNAASRAQSAASWSWAYHRHPNRHRHRAKLYRCGGVKCELASLKSSKSWGRRGRARQQQMRENTAQFGGSNLVAGKPVNN